jgi:hypothetical protein
MSELPTDERFFLLLIVPLLCVAFCMPPHEHLVRVPCDGTRLLPKATSFSFLFFSVAAVQRRCILKILDVSQPFMHTALVVAVDLMHVRRVQILVMHIIRRPVPAD